MECPHVPEISYGEFGTRLREKIESKRVPLAGSLELTLRCNLRCIHCYLGDARLGLPGNEELSHGEICDLLDQIVDEGCLWLLLTGGEPLLRPDFLDIYTYAKRKGMLVTLFTNGTILTPEIAHYLQEWRPFKIEISLYGRTKETYERVTGIPGSFERCLRGIELLLERDLPLRLKTMALTSNKDEILTMKKYADGLGVSFRFDPMVTAGVTGSRDQTRFRLTPADVLALDLADADRAQAFRRFCERFVANREKHEHLYICGAGIHSFHVDPYGRLSVCVTSRSESYDLRRASFHEAWHEFVPQVRYRKASDKYRCNECELISLCGQCPGWAQLEHGDSEARVDFLCQVAQLRVHAFSPNTSAKGVGPSHWTASANLPRDHGRAKSQ